LLKPVVVKVIPPLFPRVEKELLETPKPTISKEEPKKDEGFINIDKFFASKIQVGTIVKAENVDKSDKLLKLFVDLGEENPRQILSGIKAHYKPQELVGTQVCVVSNLKPAKIMGMESYGMILTAQDENKLSLIRPENLTKNGSTIK
jgi:methionyl-tRNA synthetase